MATSTTSVIHWTTEDVCEWLTHFPDLRQYIQVFKDHRMDGPGLLSLTSQELLNDLQVVPLGNRKKILREIASLHSTSSSSPSFPSSAESPNNTTSYNNFNNNNNNNNNSNNDFNNEDGADINTKQHANTQEMLSLFTKTSMQQEMSLASETLKSLSSEDVKNISWLIEILKGLEENLKNKLDRKTIADTLDFTLSCCELLCDVYSLLPLLPAVEIVKKVKLVLTVLRNEKKKRIIVEGVYNGINVLLALVSRVIIFLENPDKIRKFDALLSECTKKLQKTVPTSVLKAAAASGGAAIAFLAGANILLPIVGFGAQGIVAGSIAAGMMGPAVASGSLFALLQSAGVVGLGVAATGGIAIAGAAVGGISFGVYKLVQHIRENNEAEAKRQELLAPPPLIKPRTVTKQQKFKYNKKEKEN